MHYVNVVPSGQTPRIFQPLGISSHCESMSVVGFAAGTLVFSIKTYTTGAEGPLYTESCLGLNQ